MIIKYNLSKNGFGNIVSNRDYAVNPKTGLPRYEIDQSGIPVRFNETFTGVSDAFLMLDFGENYDPAKINVFVDMIDYKLAEFNTRKMKKTHYQWDKRTVNRPLSCYIKDINHYGEKVMIDYNFCQNCVLIPPQRPPAHGMKIHIANLLDHAETNDWIEMLEFLKSMTVYGTFDDSTTSGAINFNPSLQDIEAHANSRYRDIIRGCVH